MTISSFSLQLIYNVDKKDFLSNLTVENLSRDGNWEKVVNNVQGAPKVLEAFVFKISSKS
jgi:hypothetical protein